MTTRNKTRGKCANQQDLFCYICREYTKKEKGRDISDVDKGPYLAYFGVKIGYQDKAWAPYIVCKTCTEYLRQWNKEKRRSPIIWREAINHFDDCYFCLTKIIGINKNNRRNWTYPDLPLTR